MSSRDRAQKLVGMPLAQVGQVLDEHGNEGLQAGALARSSNSHCITAHVLPVRLNARRFVISNIASRGISIVAMLTGPIRLEPICGYVLFLLLQPRDNDPLHCMCKLYGRSLKQTITILVEFREILLAGKIFPKRALAPCNGCKKTDISD